MTKPLSSILLTSNPDYSHDADLIDSMQISDTVLNCIFSTQQMFNPSEAFLSPLSSDGVQ